MSSPDRDQLKVLFDQARTLPPEDRTAFLDNACPDDPALRQELVELLQAYDQAPAYFDGFAAALREAAPAMGTDPLLGQRVSHYLIQERLGGGGMGVVYKALDTKLDRTVALKFLPPYLSQDETAKQRFIREAKAASGLDHPHICTIYEIGEAGDGRLFIAMAYYAGETLKAKIARGRLPIEEALAYTVQIAEALARAHGQGIVHRDIKPANVLVTDEGIVKVVDFGLAKREGQTQLTQAGSTMGTVSYMSPEQAQGEVDHRTDLWSLGVLWYEMLTGVRPFDGEHQPAVLYRIMYKEPTPVHVLCPEVSPAIEQVIETCIKKDPKARYEETADMLAALQPLIKPMPPAPAVQQRWYRTRSYIGALAIITVALVMAYWLDPLPGPTPEAKAEDTRVVILPFEIRGGDDLGHWREDMVEVLHLAIQGAESVHSVDPKAVLSHTRGDLQVSTDPERGMEIARHFGAEWYVLGTMMRLGERITIITRLYRENANPLTIAPVAVIGEHRMQQAADTLAQRLAGTILNRAGLRLLGLAAQTTSSPEAFRQFIIGERHLRANRAEAAKEALEHALELDSTFALAALELATASFYATMADVSDDHAAYRQAERHKGRLSDPMKALLEAEVSAWMRGEPDIAEPLYRRYLRKYPHDGHALSNFGDFLYHYNPPRGRPAEESRPYFERANEFVLLREPVDHLFEFAQWDQDEERMALYEALFDSLRGVAPSLLHLTYRRMTRSAPEDRAPYIDTLGAGKFLLLPLNLYLHLEDIPGAIAANHYEPEPDRTDLRMRLEVARGRFTAADSFRVPPESELYGSQQFDWAHAAALPFSPVSDPSIASIRAAVAASNINLSPESSDTPPAVDLQTYLLGLLSYRLQDDDALGHYTEQAARRAARGTGKDPATVVVHTLRALQAARAQDVEAALQHFRGSSIPFPTIWQTTGSHLYTHPYLRYVIAELLFGAERYKEALPWFSSFLSGWDTNGLTYLGPSYLRRAQIYDELGETDNAIQYYMRFVDLWKDADPALQDWVAVAQQRLNVLLDDIIREPDDKGQPLP